MIHLAFAFHDGNGLYAFFAAATLRSVLSRTRDTLSVHIVHDDTLSGRGKTLLERVVSAYGQRLTFHSVTATAIIPDKIPEAFGPGSFYRYGIPQMSSFAGVERLIYLDCDMCALLDIAELWQVANKVLNATGQGKPPALALVPDATCKMQAARLKALGIDAHAYANSGMLVMDLPRLRQYVPNFLAALVGALARMPQPVPFPDQDALGVLCQRLPCSWIDERFNYQIHVDGRWQMSNSQLEGKLVHYCGRKPWCEPFYEAGQIFMEHYRALAAFAS